MKPFDDSIVVTMPQVQKETKTAGGIYIPQGQAEMERYAEKKCTIVDHGINAFNVLIREHIMHCKNTNTPYTKQSLENATPCIGDSVIIKDYSGVVVKDEEGNETRVIKADNILCFERKK